MHQPNRVQTGKPRRRDGVMTSVRNSTESAGCADNTNADHRQWHEDAHAKGQGGSRKGGIQSHGEVQGGGSKSGRGSNDSTTNNTSDESQQLRLKVLAEDGARQC